MTSSLELVGRLMVLMGLVVAVVGGLMIAVARLGGGLPTLPGDIVVRRPGLVIYFPIVTAIVLSIVLSLVLTMLSWLLYRR